MFSSIDFSLVGFVRRWALKSDFVWSQRMATGKSVANLIAIVSLYGSISCAIAEENTSESLFVRRIAPLLQEKCLACHGNDPEDLQGGLDLRQLASALRGGDSQTPSLVAGQPAMSPIYLAASRQHDQWSAMPPKEAEQLSQQQLTWLHEWITSGADWPDPIRSLEISQQFANSWSAEDGVLVVTSGGLAEQWTQRRYRPEGLWAYQPVVKPLVPDPAHEEIDNAFVTSGNEIDAFISAAWPEKLTPAPIADPRTLIRRLTFDLTGLPPTPEEIERFVEASQQAPQQAYQRLVEQLLDSPHYGERMAQHWLDVTRYADSSGLANDYERGNAWRYRDYVVRSFNDDKPYDQFIREQLAGDEIDPDNPELIIATGFLRMGPWELTGMEVAKVARQRFLDDVTNSVGETFLAQSLQCCRCHDHKFDPIPTRDYYAIQAVFATTQLAERAAAFLPAENTYGFDEIAYLRERQEEYIRTLEELDAQQLRDAQVWYEQNGLPTDRWNQAVANAQTYIEQQRLQTKGQRFHGAFGIARNELAKQGIDEGQYPPKLLGFQPQDFGIERVSQKGLERLSWELERYQPFALAVYNGLTPKDKSISTPKRIPANPQLEGQLETSCILNGGDPFSPGEAVTPGALSLLEQPPADQFPKSIEGRRLALAEWIADERNPLTTRAIVNRLWLWHFGQPLAGNPNNFGSTGKVPTHPELLDWLAATFVEQGWSFKKLHRLMLNSQTYRRASQHPNESQLRELDPLGHSYAAFQPRRLTAEELRDAALAASGELNRALGGIPNRPEINLEAALQPRQVMGTFAAAWVPNPLPAQRHRRSLYGLKLRGLPNPHLEVFNQPVADFSCERRETSNITPQVFSLLNGRASHARALALAHRVVVETDSDVAALVRCFELALGRQPSAEELELCQNHWQRNEQALADELPPPVSLPRKITRQAIEENTGERFEFEETLHAYADFVSDLQPHDVSLHIRSLTDVCLAILNCNEFCYVY